jgi:hypothetical protein
VTSTRHPDGAIRLAVRCFRVADTTCGVERRLHPGTPEDIVTINSITLSPDPPKPGQNLTVTVSARTSEKIDVSKLTATMRGDV